MRDTSLEADQWVGRSGKRPGLNMRYFGIAAAAGLTAATCSGVSIAADDTCLEYGPALVSLSGTITRHMEYGPPNYGEDPAHDAKELYWYLELNKAICVNGKNDEVSPESEGEN
jgi:hypothetical protein